MKEVEVRNPNAGKGKATEVKSGYLTTAPGDCRRFVKEECLREPETHFTVYGGDGTLNEAISGIMDAGAGKKATVTVVPVGSGNDTLKSIPKEKGRPIALDLIRLQDQYGVNMLNIGFDCNVVATASRYKKKKGISGKLAYILGVAHEFFGRFGEHFKLSAVCENGDVQNFEGEFMLCAVCNGGWCGGSFHNSPLSDMTDGIMELMLVKKMGHFSFLRLVNKYKSGALIDREKNQIDERFKDLVIYRRITALTISGCKQICADGEIFEMDSARISLIPGAVQYLTPLQENIEQGMPANI